MGRMKLKIGISLVAVTILNVILFQNCGGNTLQVVDHLGQKLDSGTGQPYDGKIFVVAGIGCADGTFVQSRIVVDTVTQATVVRENCQDTSRTLGPGEFTFGGSNAEEV